MNLRSNRTLAVGALLTTLVVSPAVLAQVQAEATRDRSISPQLGINFPRNRDRPDRPPPRRFGARSIDGTGNNLYFNDLCLDPPHVPDDFCMGATYTPLKRRMPSDYDDEISAMAGQDRPGPRAISNAVAAQGDRSFPNPAGASDFLWQWGQFIDHDIDLTDGMDPPNPAPILIPDDDLSFVPGTFMAFNRSIYDTSTGTDSGNPREQLNEITAWIDASNVYGSDEDRANALRTNDGTGRLKTSEGDLLPFNVDLLPNATGGPPDFEKDKLFFLAGDVRANEQVGLTAMHTLFVREHNWHAKRIVEANPGLEDEEIYERARRIVGAEMQVITYKEYLPALLGPNPIPPYQGYKPRVDARIMNIFSTAAYRYGHSALSPTLLRLDARGNEIEDGHLPLRDAFFAPKEIIEHGGIEPLLRGLANQKCQRIDPYLVDDVRNFLFGPPGSGGFDLAALNIQRGRDHGLPGYNVARAAFGLPRATSFADVSSDAEIQMNLAAVYDHVDDIDVWVGGLAEDPAPGGGHVGKLMRRIIAEQFRRLRDGDRFWYTRILSPSQVIKVENTRLSDIIRRNTEIRRELPVNVFHVPPSRSR